MTKQTSHKFSPEVRERAVRMVFGHQTEHTSQWATITSIASKIGCTAWTLLDWVKPAEVDAGKRAGVPTDVTEKLKALVYRRRLVRHRVEAYAAMAAG